MPSTAADATDAPVDTPVATTAAPDAPAAGEAPPEPVDAT